MTAKQAAEYLGVNWHRLGDWEKHEGLPTHRLGSGPKAQRRYYRSELDAWIKSRCNAQTPGRTA